MIYLFLKLKFSLKSRRKFATKKNPPRQRFAHRKNAVLNYNTDKLQVKRRILSHQLQSRLRSQLCGTISSEYVVRGERRRDAFQLSRGTRSSLDLDLNDRLWKQPKESCVEERLGKELQT